MDIFVKKTDTIVIDVYIWKNDNDNDIGASNIETEVPQGKESEIIKFTFKKPDYKDSVKIQQSIKFRVGGVDDGPVSEGLVVDFQDIILRTLLISVIQNSEVTDMKNKIDILHPAVARSAVAGILSKVSF